MPLNDAAPAPRLPGTGTDLAAAVLVSRPDTGSQRQHPAGLPVLHGSLVEQRFALATDRITTLGRAPCERPGQHDRAARGPMSRPHAELVPDGGSRVLKDLGSLGGCYHNRAAVYRAALADGDELVIAAFRMRFEACAATI